MGLIGQIVGRALGAAKPEAREVAAEAGVLSLRLVDTSGKVVAALDIEAEDRVTIEIEHGLTDVSTDDDAGDLTFMLIPEES